ISSSASGVSITRSEPNRCCKPAVARNTPPLTPTSSPSTTTFGSSCMARASARVMASTSVTSGIGAARIPAFELRTLAGVDLGKLGIEIIEHGLRRPGPHRQIVLDRLFDALLAVRYELLLIRFAPKLLIHNIGAQPCDRLLLPSRLHLLRGAVASCVIRS